MRIQTALLHHHLPGAKFRRFQEIRGGNNIPQEKAGPSPCFLLIPCSCPKSTGGATTDQLDAPQPPSGQTCCPAGCPRLPLQPAMGQLSTEPWRATIIPLTARGVFPDHWTHFLSLRIGKNLHSSKNGFQWALQVILQP